MTHIKKIPTERVSDHKNILLMLQPPIRCQTKYNLVEIQIDMCNQVMVDPTSTVDITNYKFN